MEGRKEGKKGGRIGGKGRPCFLTSQMKYFHQ
jgi:hypothetical protein